MPDQSATGPELVDFAQMLRAYYQPVDEPTEHLDGIGTFTVP